MRFLQAVFIVLLYTKLVHDTPGSWWYVGIPIYLDLLLISLKGVVETVDGIRKAKARKALMDKLAVKNEKKPL